MTATVSKSYIFAARLIGTVFLFATLVLSISGAHAAVHSKRGPNVMSGELNLDKVQRARRDGGVIRLTSSPGGTGAAAMELARARVVVDGPCNSACAWSFVANERACFTRNASFGFHAAHDPGTGRRMAAATDHWMGQVRSSLRGKLSGLYSSSNLITLSAGQMAQYYGDRACGSKVAAS